MKNSENIARDCQDYMVWWCSCGVKDFRPDWFFQDRQNPEGEFIDPNGWILLDFNNVLSFANPAMVEIKIII